MQDSEEEFLEERPEGTGLLWLQEEPEDGLSDGDGSFLCTEDRGTMRSCSMQAKEAMMKERREAYNKHMQLRDS